MCFWGSRTGPLILFLAERAAVKLQLVKLQLGLTYVVSAIKGCSCSTSFVCVTQIKAQQWYCLREERKLLARFPMLITKQWWQETGAKESSKQNLNIINDWRNTGASSSAQRGKRTVRMSDEIISSPREEKMLGCKISAAQRDSDMGASWGLYAIKHVRGSPILNGINFHLGTSTNMNLDCLTFWYESPLTYVLMSTWMVRSDSLPWNFWKLLGTKIAREQKY